MTRDGLCECGCGGTTPLASWKGEAVALGAEFGNEFGGFVQPRLRLKERT